MRKRLTGRWLGSAAVVCLAACAAALAGPPPVSNVAAQERWYVVLMQGARAGHMRWSQRIDEQGRVRTESQLQLTLERGPVAVDIAMTTSFVETAEGAPVEMAAVQRLGALPLERRWRFSPEGVELTETQAGRSTSRTLEPPSEPWLTPVQEAAALRAKLAGGERSFTLVTLDPAVGLAPVRTRYTVEGRETVEALGKRVSAVRCGVVSSSAPGAVSRAWYDRRGFPVVMETQLGGLQLRIVASEKEAALSPVEPAELLLSAFVEPTGRAITQPRALRSATYLLEGPAEAIRLLPETSAQRVEQLEEGKARVRVDLADLQPAPQEDAQAQRYLAPSAMLDAADPAVRRLARAALATTAPDASDAVKAEALRRFVHAYIEEKSLDVGFASASEVCATREGDCTEHATLLAALLRVVGIPSRVAAGLIHVDEFLGRRNVFGYHAWTQALVEDEGGRLVWLDLDATLPGAVAFDAAHIALATTAMGQGETINALAALAPLLGALRIETQHVEPAGP